jgi:hypothetical protein
MTKYEANVISAYTGILCSPIDQVHKFIEKLLGKEVCIQEVPNYSFEIKTALRSEFLQLCAEVTEPKIEEIV